MTDRLLQRLAAADPATSDRISQVARTLPHLPAQIATPPEGRGSRRLLWRRRSIWRPVAVALAAIVVVGVPLLALLPLRNQSQPGAGALLDDGWYRVGTLEDLRAQGPVLYLPDHGIFVVTTPGDPPLALLAVSPHLPAGGGYAIWCRTSGWFFTLGDGSMFDVHGNYELGPAPTGMFLGFARVTDGWVEVDTQHHAPPATSRDPLTPPFDNDGPAGPFCSPGWRRVAPGIAVPATTEPSALPTSVPVPGGVEDLTAPLPSSSPPAVTVTVDSPAAQGSVTSPLHVEGHVEGLSTGQVVVQLVEPYVFSTGAGATVTLSYALVPLELTSGAARFSTDLPFSVDATTGVQLYVQPIDDTASFAVDLSALSSSTPEQTPPARPEAFLGRWSNANGDPISDAELAVWRGTTPCGGPEMVFLRVGPSPGGIFVRDVAGTLADVTWGRFDVLQGLTQIPEPAEDTGDHIGSWHLWLPTADAGVVYVVDGSGHVPVIERWPLYISPDPCTANIT